MTTYPDPVRVDFVRGDASGLSIPAHAEALEIAGAAFLTDAFRHFGSLSADNRVTRITRCEPFQGGGSGHKLVLSVAYAYAEPGLSPDLFVKFSRSFENAFFDRRRYELETETRLASLSRLPNFPITVPTAYFADYHHESGTGVLITERIAFGADGIEPLHPKCKDDELAEPIAYYRVMVSALARLAAAHKSGRLSPHVDELFPFDPEAAAKADPIPWNEQDVRERIARYAAFAARCPQLLPPQLATSEFVAHLEGGAVRFLSYETAIKRFLHSDRDFIALCHWNAHIDNAWFWREPSRGLQCGLLDWGRVQQINVASALWGCLSAASLDIWDHHLDDLLTLFTDELQRHGGPRLAVSKLKLHLHLYIATIGLTTLLDIPALILAKLPEAVHASGPRDPIFAKNAVVSAFLHIFTVYMNLWQKHDLGASLERLLERRGNSAS
jgi:hypothetical protein